MAAYQQVSDLFGEASAINNLGLIELRRGRYQQAASHLEQALLLSQAIGKPISEACSLTNLGVVDLQWLARQTVSFAAKYTSEPAPVLSGLESQDMLNRRVPLRIPRRPSQGVLAQALAPA